MGDGFNGSAADVQCPDNVCWGQNQYGSYVQFVATMNGNYFQCDIAGDFSTQQAAGKAATTCGIGESKAWGVEFSGNIYQSDDGSYSFTLPATIFDPHHSAWDPANIPDGTTYAGFYHTHDTEGENDVNEQFSGRDEYLETSSPMNLAFPTYLGTAGGRIIMYDPFQIMRFPNGCVLVGSPTPVLPIINTSIPQC